MLTIPKLIVLGLFIGISGYAIWMNRQDSTDTYYLTKTREMSNLINIDPDSQKHPGTEKLISLVNKMHKQLSTQQDQLKEQQVAINTLFDTLKEREMFSPAQSGGDDNENSDLKSEEEHTAKQIEILDTALANEAIDEKWSKAAVETVSEIFDQVMPEGTAITQLDCQSTFCKIGLDHLNESEMDGFLDDFMFKLGWQTSSFIQTTENEDGSKATVVYLSRDGYSLPEV